ncbi:4-alpha-glucanotransferase [Crenothrix sp. D3]|nr:4-alpha-glucanotransferase [Crenothrix sp. D3]
MSTLLNKRRAGILLHITSLPGAGQQGDLGQDAYNFVNFLVTAGITVWQTLPLGVTHADGSPYQCLSAHAGNPQLISIDSLVESGWLLLSEQCEDCQRKSVKFYKNCLLSKAFYGFLERATPQDKTDFENFCRDKAFWLDDFSLFMALRNEYDQQCWNQWPDTLKNRDANTIKMAKHRLKDCCDIIKFEQYVFFRQWMALKAYANERGILLFGDIPIFVSYDSADVWANRQVFKLDEVGEMLVVAGVPPDYFSETGQRWGNPHYNWDYLLQTGFHWWIERMQTQCEQFDILRIDHFRGLEAAWEIPASEPTAQVGQWVTAPGSALLKAIIAALGEIALVAEDLGIITAEVDALRNEFNLPGMKILQFAFGGDADNPYLPDNYEKNCVAYTGTHDNDTTVGWEEKLSEGERNYIFDYLGNPSTSLQCALIQTALASVANLAIIPMQDVLELGTDHRMNTPGTTVGNWKWRFQWYQLVPERAARLAYLVELFNRK